MNSKQLAFACAQVACDAKASDIAIYDLRGTSSITYQEQLGDCALRIRPLR